MKIVLHGACSFSFLFREMILRAQHKKMDVEWKVMVRTWRHLELFRGVLEPADVFYPHERINALMREPAPGLSILAGHPGSIAKDLAADKDMPGQIRRRDKTYQMRNVLAHYQAYREYLEREKPDAVLLPSVETHEARVLLSLTRELGIEPLVLASARNLLLFYFSRSPNGGLPPYVLRGDPPAALVEKARSIVDGSREKTPAAWGFTRDAGSEEVLPFRRNVPAYRKLHRLPVFLLNLARDAWREPHAGQPNPLWHTPIMQFWSAYKRVMSVRARWQRRFFDVLSVEQLPDKFIYFPLHFRPEWTVTTMAPYFEDPLRAVDWVRLHMPADHVLVVKEHPDMKTRPTSFYKDLRRRAGVMIADSAVPGTEMIRRAALTLTVTGTAAFEALLMGRPALTLGEAFFTPWVPRWSSGADFGRELAAAMGRPREEIRAKAVDCVARTLDAGHDFTFFDPHDPGVNPDHLMNVGNLDRMLDALQDHLKRLDGGPPAARP